MIAFPGRCLRRVLREVDAVRGRGAATVKRTPVPAGLDRDDGPVLVPYRRRMLLLFEVEGLFVLFTLLIVLVA